MAQTKRLSNFFLKFASGVSIFGLIIVFAFLYQPLKDELYPAFSKLLIGSLYATICLLGILAIFYPKNCENSLMFKRTPQSQERPYSANISGTVRIKGHHPDCQYFSKHWIEIRKRTLCAACIGLLIGAMASLAGTIFYFFVGFVPFFADLRVLLVGYAGMLLGLFQFKLGGYVKLTANALFVFSTFITLIAADTLGASLLVDFYVIGLFIFLLLTRILISEWNNKRICTKCEMCRLLE